MLFCGRELYLPDILTFTSEICTFSEKKERKTIFILGRFFVRGEILMCVMSGLWVQLALAHGSGYHARLCQNHPSRGIKFPTVSALACRANLHGGAAS